MSRDIISRDFEPAYPKPSYLDKPSVIVGSPASGKWIDDSHYQDAEGNSWLVVMEGGAWKATTDARPGVTVSASVAEGGRDAIPTRIDAGVAVSPTKTSAPSGGMSTYVKFGLAAGAIYIAWRYSQGI